MACKKHRMELSSYSGNELSFRCWECREEMTRPPTKPEAQWIDGMFRNMFYRMKIHVLYHRFAKLYIGENGELKVKGWALMKKARLFVRNHPECLLTTCDDNLHCSSSILLIPHESETEFWGTTAVIIPQCGEPTIVFFYPRCMTDLLNAARMLSGRYLAKEKPHRQEMIWRSVEQYADGKFTPEPAVPLDQAYLRRRQLRAKRRADKAMEKLDKMTKGMA